MMLLNKEVQKQGSKTYTWSAYVSLHQLSSYNYTIFCWEPSEMIFGAQTIKQTSVLLFMSEMLLVSVSLLGEPSFVSTTLTMRLFCAPYTGTPASKTFSWFCCAIAQLCGVQSVIASLLSRGRDGLSDGMKASPTLSTNDSWKRNHGAKDFRVRWEPVLGRFLRLGKSSLCNL